MREDDLLAKLAVAVAAAHTAGEAIMNVYRSGFDVAYKSDSSPLTAADTLAHAAIAAALEVTGLPVLSEEGREIPASVRTAWDLYWLVDPLDGTREFVGRNGEFTVNIALMQREGDMAAGSGAATPILGVLYAPVTDTLYFAWRGGGAHKQEALSTWATTNGKERVPMGIVLPLERGQRGYTILASRSHLDPLTETFIREKNYQEGNVLVLGMGSALKFGLMAEGKADTYPRFAPTMEWDTAAGQIICQEAGLELIDMGTGAPMRYNKNELVNGPFIVQ